MVSQRVKRRSSTSQEDANLPQNHPSYGPKSEPPYHRTTLGERGFVGRAGWIPALVNGWIDMMDCIVGYRSSVYGTAKVAVYLLAVYELSCQSFKQPHFRGKGAFRLF